MEHANFSVYLLGFLFIYEDIDLLVNLRVLHDLIFQNNGVAYKGQLISKANFLVGILVQLRKIKFAFEIIWPLDSRHIIANNGTLVR